jgi:hypothetical protein
MDEDTTTWRVLKRNDERYTPKPGRWPDEILVHGTVNQARFVAESLSNFEAGCDYFWYVEGSDDE